MSMRISLLIGILSDKLSPPGGMWCVHVLGVVCLCVGCDVLCQCVGCGVSMCWMWCPVGCDVVC